MSWELAGNIMGPEGPPGSIADAPVTSVFGRIGAIVADSADYAAYYQPLGSFPVTSVFGRTGAIAAAAGDYAAFYASLSGSYANPSWITSLAWSKITGAPATGVSSVFGRAGAVVADVADYNSYYVRLDGSYSNPPWLTSLPWSKISGAPSFEPALGNPSVNGYILSSTTAGVRSWIAPPSGGGGTLTFTGDVIGSGTSTINLQIAANAVGAAEIVANSIGASEINNTQDLGLAALQTIKLSTAATNDRQNVLGLYRNSTGTPVAGFGSRLELGAKSDTTNDRPQVQLASSWVVPTDATRQAKLELLCSQGDGLFGTAVMTLWGSKGVSLNRTVDPGAGWMDVSAGFKVGGTQIGLDDLLASATNDSAAAGDIGQIVSSYIASPGSAMSNNVAKNIASISLTAGDWDVRGSVVIVPTNIASNGAEVGQAAIGTTSASLNVDGSNQVNGQSNPTAAAQSLAYSMSLPPRRFSLSATTTIYLVGMTGGNAASRTGYGYIEARRVR